MAGGTPGPTGRQPRLQKVQALGALALAEVLVFGGESDQQT